MKVRKSSIKKIKHYMKKRTLVCFGAGRTLQKFCQDLRNSHIEDMPICVLDNDPNKNGTYIDLGFPVVIRSLDYFLKNLKGNEFIVITSEFYSDEIACQLMNTEALKRIPCFYMPSGETGLSAALFWIFKKLPLRNALLFQGPGDFCDNAQAIRDYLISAGLIKKYNLIWIVDDTAKFNNSPHQKYILRDCLLNSKSIYEKCRYIYSFSTSKFLFYEDKAIPKYRKNQKLIFLRHSAFMLKKTKGVVVTPRNVDHIICPSEKCVSIVCEQTRSFPEQIIICGSPRTDNLFKEDCVIDQLIKTTASKIIIWMPTFRRKKNTDRVDSSKSFSFGIPILNTTEDIMSLNKILKESNTVLIIKPHPNQDISAIKINRFENIKIVLSEDISNKDIKNYELLKDTDALITDYSSVSFDYMLLDRPIAYTLDDMKEYTKGFAIDNPLDYMPGEHISDMEGLYKFITDVANNYDPYKEDRRKICDMINKYKNGNNSKRLMDILGIK